MEDAVYIYILNYYLRWSNFVEKTKHATVSNLQIIVSFLPFFVDLTEVMASSNDWDTLLWAWEGWREETGPKIKDLFPRSVELSNKAAVIGGKDFTKRII